MSDDAPLLDDAGGNRDATAPREKTVELLRSFCQEWLDRADPAVPTRIMREDYEVHIGGVVLSGLSQYVPATLGQLEDFSGLQISVHELVSNGSEMALRFTEHGASLKAGGRPAAWRGIALFWSDGVQLLRNVTEEDYTARRRQLIEGSADTVDAPAVAPWSTRVLAQRPEAEQQVRDWLVAGGLGDGSADLIIDDGSASSPLLGVDSTTVLDLFSCGDAVGFRAVERGLYLGGLGLPDSAEGAVVSLTSVGLVRVAEGERIRGHLVRDRAGLRRALSRV